MHKRKTKTFSFHYLKNIFPFSPHEKQYKELQHSMCQNEYTSKFIDHHWLRVDLLIVKLSNCRFANESNCIGSKLSTLIDSEDARIPNIKHWQAENCWKILLPLLPFAVKRCDANKLRSFLLPVLLGETFHVSFYYAWFEILWIKFKLLGWITEQSFLSGMAFSIYEERPLCLQGP